MAAPAVSRLYADLDPTDQHTVLTAGLTHLYAARGRARRNGTAPDTSGGAPSTRPRSIRRRGPSMLTR
ncbi:hypothetical protein [Streptomyces longisporus]|uniref:Uncharacterized protein n=1 Tax=Streptomyces longisporus TaxID=1948 RepID=A0ABN3NM25_STRLO